jgi:hypothetical protein
MRGIALAILLLAMNLHPAAPSPGPDITFEQLVEMWVFAAMMICIVAGK